jgi:hypothetical protein
MDPNFKWTCRAEKLLVADYWWQQQKGLCHFCGEPMLPYRRYRTKSALIATFEHLKPKREGGQDTAGNVRLAHMLCNNVAGGLWEENKYRARNGMPLISESERIDAAKAKRKHQRDWHC